MVIKSDKTRLLVLGDNGVGKSALTVRFLTGRFIGTYQSEKDMFYKTNVAVCDEDKENQGKSFKAEFCDSCRAANELGSIYPSDREMVSGDRLDWATGVIIVYSVTSGSSFLYATRLLNLVKNERPNVPCVLVGNKCDLSHARSVIDTDAEMVAAKFSSKHIELSAATEPQKVISTLSDFAHTVSLKTSDDKSYRPADRRRRKSIVDIARSVFKQNREKRMSA